MLEVTEQQLRLGEQNGDCPIFAKQNSGLSPFCGENHTNCELLRHSSEGSDRSNRSDGVASGSVSRITRQTLSILPRIALSRSRISSACASVSSLYPRRWSKPCTARRSSSESGSTPRDSACRIAVSTEIMMSPSTTGMPLASGLSPSN